MLKKLLFLSAAFALVLPAFAQHQRRVLIEEFTNASCPPCASQNPAFNATLKANEEFLTPVKYQTNWPGFDPMNQQTQTEVLPRVQYYGVDGVPNGRQNGVLEVFPMNTYSATTIQNAYNNLTPVTITLSHSFTADYDSVLIDLAIKSEVDLTGTLRLRVAVLENEIIFNEPPGSTNEKEFFQVMRKMLPNSSGTATGDFAAGETKTYSFAWPMKNIYDLNELCAAAWLQNDATKEVWQSERTFPIGGIPAAGVEVVADKTFACATGAAPYFTLTNTAAGQLTSVDLRYRIANGAWKDMTWTGDLAPGASELVTLTGEEITGTGTTKLDVEILRSNNGIQTNMVSGAATIEFKSIFGPASLLPFENTFQSAAFPPAGWSAFNVGTNGWKLATNAGANSSRSARCNFYAISSGKAYLATPKIDLSQANGPTTLKFDHAYVYFSSTLFDSLRIEASADCGVTWTTIFHDGKDGLATAPPVASPSAPGWVPSSPDEWAFDNTIDISAFNGTPELLIRFVGESGYGNNLYIDNLSISTIVGVKELTLSTFNLQPNPTRDFAQVRFGLEKPESIQLSVFNAQGVLVQSKQLGDLPSGEHAVELSAINLPSGSYQVVLQGKEGVAHAQWVVVK